LYAGLAVFGEFMRTGVASDEVQFTVKEDAGLVSRLYQEGFVKTVTPLRRTDPVSSDPA
jgi:hypothetical protein